MDAITWIERITDETNPWLAANKKEEDGDLLVAFALYLEDAGECLKQNAPVKAALSCSCAADCLAKLGRFHEAQLLIEETAHLYLENADSTIGKSVREALWSLREAHAYFQLAEDATAVSEVRGRLIRLASRVDPSMEIGELTHTLSRTPSIFGGFNTSKGHSANESFGPDGSSLITESIERFMRLRKSRYALGARLEPAPSKAGPRRRGPINEESIISQLG